jgi:hypothetical protein
VSDDLRTISAERVEKYLDITDRARKKATPLVDKDSSDGEKLEMMLRMADDYSSDARHFLEIGDHVRAFGAINYAHGWIDAGVKLGFLDGHGDDVLFTLP